MIEAWREFAEGEGKNYQVDCRIVRPDGSIAWLISRATREYGANGELLGYVGSITDVTDLKEAQSALEHSEHRFALAMKGANDGVWDWHAGTGEFYYSPRWAEMLGYQSGELPNTGEAWEAILHPDDRPQIDQNLIKCLKGQTNSYTVEFRLRHKDGHYVDILSRVRGAWR